MKKLLRRSKILLSLILVAAMTANVFLYADTSVQAAVKTKKYVVSHASGTYDSAITVKVKAKKGYKIYYTVGTAKFKPSKVISSGSSKKISISKTKTLRIIAVKTLSNQPMPLYLRTMLQRPIPRHITRLISSPTAEPTWQSRQ